MSGQAVPDNEIRKYLARLSAKDIPELHRSAQELQVDEAEELLEETPLDDQEDALVPRKIDSRKLANDASNATLGENPKARREEIRSTLPDGFYICASGKRGALCEEGG